MERQVPTGGRHTYTAANLLITSDIEVIAYLLSHGAVPVKVDRRNPRRVAVAFGSGWQQPFDAWVQGTISAELRGYIIAMQRAWDLVKGTEDPEEAQR